MFRGSSTHNLDAKGRQKNRRIVLVIAKDGAVQRLLNPKTAILTPVVKEDEKVVEAPPPKNGIPVVKEIKTDSGGIKFTRGVVKPKEPEKP